MSLYNWNYEKSKRFKCTGQGSRNLTFIGKQHCPGIDEFFERL